MKKMMHGIMAFLSVILLSATMPASAEPPYWAPAHGYHAKQAKAYKQNQGISGLDVLNKHTMGSLVGAALGGLLGAQIGKGNGKLATTAAGTMIGYVLGGKLMDYMDQSDRYRSGHVLENTRDHQTIAWTNPNTQADYQVTPIETYQQAGQYCRDYVTHAVIGNQSEEVYGKACRQSDGTWRVDNI